LASTCFAATASALTIGSPPANAVQGLDTEPRFYTGLGSSIAGVRLGKERPVHAIAAGVLRIETARDAGGEPRYQNCVVVLVPHSPKVVMEIADSGEPSFGESLASHDSTLLIGAPGSRAGCGRVRVVDVDAPDTARWLEGFDGAREFGAQLVTVSDADGASYRALVSASRTPVADGARGAVALHRDANGAPLWIQRAFAGEIDFGRTLAALGDVDGDGASDFAVSSRRGARGAVALLSSQDGRRLLEWVGDADGDDFGSGLAGVSDLDGDGHADLAIGVPRQRCADGFAGEVQLVSTGTGKTIRTLQSDCAQRGRAGADPQFGRTLLSSSSRPGAGSVLVVGEPGGYASGADTGCVSAWSPASSECRSRFGWRTAGFRPWGFGGSLAACTIDVGVQPALLVGGFDGFGGGLQVQTFSNVEGPPTTCCAEPAWEIFAGDLQPPDRP
jgi:hypothetical protein